jgi:hypothetical protein
VSLSERLRKLESVARSIKRPLGPLVLIEGQDGSRQEILDRLEEAIREGNKGPLIIFAADRPTSFPLA